MNSLKNIIELMCPGEDVEIYDDHINESKRVWAGPISGISKNIHDEYDNYCVSSIGLNQNTRSIMITITQI